MNEGCCSLCAVDVTTNKVFMCKTCEENHCFPRTGRPDFGPGDKVIWLFDDSLPPLEVEGVYLDRDRKWCVVFTNKAYDYVKNYKLVPKRKTVTLTITGPKEGVDKVLTMMTGKEAFETAISHGVYVDRVEEEGA